MNVRSVLETKNIVVNQLFLEAALKLDLDLKEFFVLMFFINADNKQLDIDSITKYIKIPENEALEAFNSLIDKKLISVIAKKSANNKMSEEINVDSFYSFVLDELKLESDLKVRKDIYSIFEEEFKRPLSSMEYEIISTWLSKEFSEELIIGALKEAVYNGVSNLRYIDKILYEWQRKGYTKLSDVEKNLKNHNKSSKNTKELFDYNWLDDVNE